MKSKNRIKYVDVENKLHSLGYNPQDIWDTKTCSDFNSFGVLYTIKSSTIKAYAIKTNLSFKRTITGKETFIGKGCWLKSKEDYVKFKDVLLPFVLAFIESGKIRDIRPSGDNQ